MKDPTKLESLLQVTNARERAWNKAGVAPSRRWHEHGATTKWSRAQEYVNCDLKASYPTIEQALENMDWIVVQRGMRSKEVPVADRLDLTGGIPVGLGNTNAAPLQLRTPIATASPQVQPQGQALGPIVIDDEDSEDGDDENLAEDDDEESEEDDIIIVDPAALREQDQDVILSETQRGKKRAREEEVSVEGVSVYSTPEEGASAPPSLTATSAASTSRLPRRNPTADKNASVSLTPVADSRKLSPHKQDRAGTRTRAHKATLPVAFDFDEGDISETEAVGEVSRSDRGDGSPELVGDTVPGPPFHREPTSKTRKTPAVKKSSVPKPQVDEIFSQGGTRETNPYHESHLFDQFGIPPPLEKKKREKPSFHLRDYTLKQYSTDLSPVVALDLLLLASPKQLEEGVILSGYASLASHASDAHTEGGSPQPDTKSAKRRVPAPDNGPEAFNGCSLVRFVKSDFVSLKPGLAVESARPELWLETRLARYRLDRPAESYLPLLENAAVLMNWAAFDLEHGVRGRGFAIASAQKVEAHTKAKETMVVELKKRVKEESEAEATAARRERANASEGLQEHFELPAGRALRHYRKHLERPGISSILFALLPNPLFVTPYVYERLLPYLAGLAPDMVRTDEAFDVDAAWARIAAGEALLKGMYDEVAAADDVDEDAIELLGKPLEKSTFAPCRIHPKAEGEEKEIQTYLSAEIDSVRYHAGECVMVNGKLADVARPGRCKRRAPPKRRSQESDDEEDSDEEEENDIDKQPKNVPWFGKIMYFFTFSSPTDADGADEFGKFAHISWFSSRDDLWMGRKPDPRQLFYADWCDSERISTIIRKVDINRLPPGRMDRPPSGFYTWAFADQQEAAFLDSADLEGRTDLALCVANSVHPCACCERRAEEALLDIPRFTDNSKTFCLSGRVYHLGDLVYILPLQLPGHYRLARLISATSDSIRVEWLFRRDDLVQARVQDERRLVLSHLEADLTPDQLEGTFALDHRDTVVGDSADKHDALARHAVDPDAFYCDERLEAEWKDVPAEMLRSFRLGDPPPGCECWSSARVSEVEREEIPTCSACAVSREAKVQDADKTKQLVRDDREQRARLSGLAAYAGLGGLDMGLEAGSSLLKTMHVVETQPAALAALKASIPLTTSYDYPFSDFLEAGFNHDPRIPAPSEIDFVSAGCPCQGFSTCNLFKRPDDSRCLEPFVWLSAMDLWRPLFGVFENVREIKTFVLPGDYEPGQKQGGLVHLLVDCLLGLGYQIRQGVLQAAAFGVPQKRLRYILSVALRGLPLPRLPDPTHAFKSSHIEINTSMPDRDERAYHFTRTKGAAPHPFVTLHQAISDLPPFEFEDPGQADRQQLEVRKQMQMHPIPWAGREPIGFKTAAPYASSHPLTSFQRAARYDIRYKEVSASTSVNDHVVRGHDKQEIVERFCGLKVAGQGGNGNHKDLIPRLRPYIPPTVKRPDDCYKRCSPDDVVTTLRTTLNHDGTSHGPRIHPTQNRPLSVREYARAQGFADGTAFQGADEESIGSQLKMLGNAVPPPLGRAIARKLHAVLQQRILENPQDPFGNARALAWMYRRDTARIYAASGPGGDGMKLWEDDGADEMTMAWKEEIVDSNGQDRWPLQQHSGDAGEKSFDDDDVVCGAASEGAKEMDSIEILELSSDEEELIVTRKRRRGGRIG